MTTTKRNRRPDRRRAGSRTARPIETWDWDYFWRVLADISDGGHRTDERAARWRTASCRDIETFWRELTRAMKEQYGDAPGAAEIWPATLRITAPHLPHKPVGSEGTAQREE